MTFSLSFLPQQFYLFTEILKCFDLSKGSSMCYIEVTSQSFAVYQTFTSTFICSAVFPSNFFSSYVVDDTPVTFGLNLDNWIQLTDGLIDRTSSRISIFLDLTSCFITEVSDAFHTVRARLVTTYDSEPLSNVGYQPNENNIKLITGIGIMSTATSDLGANFNTRLSFTSETLEIEGSFTVVLNRSEQSSNDGEFTPDQIVIVCNEPSQYFYNGQSFKRATSTPLTKPSLFCGVRFAVDNRGVLEVFYINASMSSVRFSMQMLPEIEIDFD
ncbi:hypothetical protein GEMRC1_007433 [Eukaryota sp. GEM-RC1]